MKAVRIHEHGGADVLRVDEIDVPVPGPGQILVRIEAAGVNFIDTYHRKGLYKVSLPFALGREGAGIIEQVGEGVTDLAVGDRVGFALESYTYADYTVVPAARAVRVPNGVNGEQAAAVLVQGITAHYLATSTYPVQAGDWTLVHAAAGGTGQLLTQVIKLRGGHVIGTVSTAEKAVVAREAGADHVINYVETDFVAPVKELTEGRGVDVVYDSVGVDTFSRSLDCLKPRGMLVLFGQSSGPVPPLDPQVLNQKGSLFLTRPYMGHYIMGDELHTRASEVFEWVRDDKMRPSIDRRFALHEAADAHRYLESRAALGKILLIPQ